MAEGDTFLKGLFDKPDEILEGFMVPEGLKVPDEPDSPKDSDEIGLEVSVGEDDTPVEWFSTLGKPPILTGVSKSCFSKIFKGSDGNSADLGRGRKSKRKCGDTSETAKENGHQPLVLKLRRGVGFTDGELLQALDFALSPSQSPDTTLKGVRDGIFEKIPSSPRDDGSTGDDSPRLPGSIRLPNATPEETPEEIEKIREAISPRIVFDKGGEVVESYQRQQPHSQREAEFLKEARIPF
jgi:hypothetical protein